MNTLLLEILANKVKQEVIKMKDVPKDIQDKVQAIIDKEEDTDIDKQIIEFVTKDNLNEVDKKVDKNTQKLDMIGGRTFAMPAMMMAIRQLIKESDLSEEDLQDMIDIYEPWEDYISSYIKKDTIIRYEGKLYKVVKGLYVLAHLTPDVATADYKEIAPDEVDIPIWKAPTNDTNHYSEGEQVTYEGKVYESRINANTTEPTKDEPHNRYWKEV